jgi:hypothetical protein
MYGQRRGARNERERQGHKKKREGFLPLLDACCRLPDQMTASHGFCQSNASVLSLSASTRLAALLLIHKDPCAGIRRTVR